MSVGVVSLRVRLFGVRSLKEKRGILKRLMNDLRKKYNISISDRAVIERVFDSIIDYLDLYPGMEVEEIEREVW